MDVLFASARCPRCGGPLFNSTINGEFAEAGPSLSCLLCGEMVYLPGPPQAPRDLRPSTRGRPRKVRADG